MSITVNPKQVGALVLAGALTGVGLGGAVTSMGKSTDHDPFLKQATSLGGLTASMATVGVGASLLVRNVGPVAPTSSLKTNVALLGVGALTMGVAAAATMVTGD